MFRSRMQSLAAGLLACGGCAASPQPPADNANTGDAAAEVLRFNANLDGNQVAPPTNSPAIGSAVLSFDQRSNTLTYDINASGIESTVRFAHFHVGGLGEGGPVVHDLQRDIVSSAGGLVRIEGTWPDLTEQDRADLMTGTVYIMIHTTAFVGGELRGQVLREEEQTQEQEQEQEP